MEKPKLIFPCNENWEQMKKSSNGRHCSDCDKVIKDYTSASTEEILSDLNKSNQMICGNFHSNQISFNTTSYTINNFKTLSLSILTLLGLTSGQDIFAQTETSNVNSISTKLNKLKFPLKLTGKIKDKKSNEVLPYAVVILKQHDKVISSTQTDLDGAFTLALKKDDVSDTSFSLNVSYLGYTSLTNYNIALNDSLINNSIFSLDLTLAPNTSSTSKGEIILRGYVAPMTTKEPSTNVPEKK